jgi:hypothetical protein
MAKSKALVPAHNTLTKAFSIVPYLTREEIKRMVTATGVRHVFSFSTKMLSGRP